MGELMRTQQELDAILKNIREEVYETQREEGALVPTLLVDGPAEIVMSVPLPDNLDGERLYRRNLPNGPWEDARDYIHPQN